MEAAADSRHRKVRIGRHFNHLTPVPALQICVMSQGLVLPDSENFTHLHLHTVYSLLDGAIRIEDLMKHVSASGMRAVAMTDHGNMFGTIDFYESAKKNGIKPIIGSEMYVAPGSRTEQREMENLADGRAYHLILLAKNETGYKNLIQLSSKAYTEGYYYKPRIDYDLLAEHSEGLIASTACLAGEVNRRLYQGETEKAQALAGKLSDIMGRGNFFLEIMHHGLKEETVVAKGAADLAKKMNLPLLLTNDAHFLRREDQKAQEIMLRIQTNKKINDPLNFAFNDEFYVKSPAEMRSIFPELPEAANNTMLVADMVDLNFNFGVPLLPDFQTPRGLSLGEYLDELSRTGLKRLFHGEAPAEYRERLEYELSVIHNMKFDGYFLIVADFIAYARNQKIPVGPGRGSAAGSLVAWSLGITNLDPLKYNLLFERFLNPSRNEMPDIDIDFCRDRREEVIKYVVDKYGEDHVSQIITFGTLSAKAVIKDVARVLDINYQTINSLTKILPDTPGIKLDDALAESPEAKEFLDSTPVGKTLYEVSKKLEGIPRNSGKHAAGVVIAPRPLNTIVPLAKDTSSGSIITQFEKGPLEKVGLVKIDFLGLKNLTVIDYALREIERRHQKLVDLEHLPLDDEKAYELLQTGQTKGIFQVESAGITKLLIQAKPRVFEDIVACIALYRPGPLESGMTASYIERKNGKTPVVYPHPDLKPVLEDTFGTFVYQEQIMLISQIAGGFNMAEADTLRKAMGKKNAEVMDKMKEKFVTGAVQKGHDTKWASDLFDNMAEFAKYGFNKSHSAAYGLITYQTAWLKANYPVEFMKASLDADIETTDKLIGFIKATRDMGIQVLPPDINESNSYFTIINDTTLRYGLLGLKGIGANAADMIMHEKKENGPYRDISDFAVRTEKKILTRKLLESLAFAGAFDSLGVSRATVIDNIDELLRFASRMREDANSDQVSLFSLEDAPPPTLELSLKQEYEFDEKLRLEKDILGLYLTAHPIDSYADSIPYANITRLEDIDDGVSRDRKVTVFVVIEGMRTQNRKSGTPLMLVDVSDHSGKVELRVNKNMYEKFQSLFQPNSVVLIDLRSSIFREDGTIKIFSNIMNISEARSLQQKVSKSFHLLIENLPVTEMQSRIASLKNIISKFSGPNPVYLHYKSQAKPIQVMKVHPTYFVEDTEELLQTLNAAIPGQQFFWRRGGTMDNGSTRVALQKN